MKKNTHSKNKKILIEGVISTTSKGLGFVSHPDWTQDIRIEAGFLNTALHGDTVEVTLHGTPFGAPPLGEVVNISQRKRSRFVGTVEKQDGTIFVVPDDRHIYTNFIVTNPPDDLKEKDKALIELVRWSDPAKSPLAKVIEIIGAKGEHNVEIRSIILEKGIDDSFPSAVKKETEKINETNQKFSQEEYGNRRDFRNTVTFTIDPVDAKDFDDALSYEKLPGGLHAVGIHIADVSHYVLPNSELDKEALKRAFSVYLVDRTIPMLPEVLSNDLCSLKPNVDRFTFSAWFVLDNKGIVKERWFGKSVIHSQKRFTYEEAQEVINNGSGPFLEELKTLNDLSKIMREDRMNMGSIDFEQHEVRFELNADGVPLEAYTKERLDTHKLIEEFMLLANREVAQCIETTYGKKKRHSFIYRVHDTPNKEKLGELSVFVKALGYTLHMSKDGSVTGKALNELFEAVTGTPEETLIKTAALRSMAKAAYAAANIGHFGLALPYYTHFTSPIRRYADLLVHRLLQMALTQNKLPNEKWTYYHTVAQQISGRELQVIEAERESIKYKQVEFLSGKVGRIFEGTISGVSEWGVFVQEAESKAEGLVRINTIGDDYYVLEQKKYRLIGQKTKKTYSLGDPVKVKLLNADVDRKMIDFVLA